MASLADLVLDADDLDELALEDEDLIRELEELNALRAARNPESAAASATCTPSARLSTPGKTAASLGKAAGLGNTAKASLADRIADGVDDVDREFQAMEKELQQQLLKYKEQCQAEPVVTASGTAGSRPASQSSALDKERPAAMPAEGGEEAGNDIATPELLHLRTEAAKMEENFPEVREVSHAAEQKPRDRRVRRVVNSYNGSREEVVESKEMTDMKQMLASLDVRMTAIQQKHSLHDGSDYKPASALPAAATRAIAELQAQNSHLRDRFSASDKRGLLQIDPSVFGAEEKPPKGMSASPQAEAAGYVAQ